MSANDLLISLFDQDGFQIQNLSLISWLARFKPVFIPLKYAKNFVLEILSVVRPQFCSRASCLLRQELGADIVIVNAENSAGGAGNFTDQLIAAGVDAVTLGDHVWDQKKFENEIGGLDQVCRPASCPSKPWAQSLNCGKRWLSPRRLDCAWTQLSDA